MDKLDLYWLKIKSNQIRTTVKLRIIFIIDSLISGGAERVMVVIANKLSEYGYDVSIFSKARLPSFFVLNESVKLVYPDTVVNYRNTLTILYTRLRLYVSVYRYLKKKRPDVVIPFSTNTNGITIIICKLLKLPVIASEHNNFRLNLKSPPVWFIKRHIYPLADILTVLTERDKDEYYGRFMKNVTVMPNPLGLDPLENHEDIERGKTILAVGELSRSHQKGFDILLEIFSKLANDYPDWGLVIAGSGDPGSFSSMISKSGLNKRVFFTGEVSDIQTLMRKCSIYALTSRWEGLPMVLLEAMSQGMACIAFDCYTGPRELINDRTDGILIKDQDIMHFVTELKMLLDDQDWRAYLGRNAVVKSKQYLPDRIVEMWDILLESLKSGNE
jgi:GalNAc-alpha-(1->4)-GalNAc-alpha-(1->3)-diNAcBac-PP-undecaprenol alpha-1,4-N-acetyl-D-galactosaminyltransferase